MIDYGWAVALQLQDRNEIFRCGFGQTSEAQGRGILRELEFLSGAEDLCGEDFGFDAADRGDYVTLRSDQEIDNFVDQVRREVSEKLVAEKVRV